MTQRSLRMWGSAILLALPLTASPISRVGTSIGDSMDGFWMTIPSSSRAVNAREDSGVRTMISRVGSYSGQPSFGPLAILDILPFADEFPALTTLSRDELRTSLYEKKWETSATQLPCVEAWRAFSDSATYALITWGRGKGAVFVGERDFGIDEAIEEMIRSLRLEEGACAWN